MLDPRDRGVLLEALRPPPGYVVHSALATTFSLDLVALLTAPLAFSLYDRLQGREGGERLDSLTLLRSVREHAEQLVVFCQSGRIAHLKEYRQLLTYLEGAVVQAHPRSEMGSFHPKVWIQRFTAPDEPVRYRMLCLSRNLTFDRSWDTMLVMDGELQDRKNAIAVSKPLAEFVEALPSFALAPLAPARKAIVDRFADELRRVSFDVPEGFDSFAFWPIGHDGKSGNPFKQVPRIERMLVVSPFVTGGRLEQLTKQGKNHVLVSRLEELEPLARSVLGRFSEVLVLHDNAEIVDEDDHADDAAPVEPLLPPSQGLHAKLYVADDGWNAHVWTGSANASDAAFEDNVELLVQLTGKKSRHGVDATLNGTEGSLGLRALLAAFTPPAAPVVQTEIEKRLEDMLRRSNLAIARAPWVAHVERTPDAGDAVDGATETFTVKLTLASGTLVLPDGCTARVWPIALPDGRGVVLATPPTATFERCSFRALTAFFAFEITAKAGARVDRSTFVVTARLEGAPADRSARVLHSLLDDPAKVMRFLQMLLAADGFDSGLDILLDPAAAATSADGPQGRDELVPLFESLVRTLDREPQRLVEVERLLRELRSTPEGRELLPKNFDEVWSPLWAAYQTLPRSGRGQ